jgi:hypothetical protein
LLVVFLVGFMAMLAAPALSKTRPNGQSAQCLSNMRALMSAWQMYAHDNSDRMVIAIHGGENLGGVGSATFGVGWVSGWQDWSTGTDNTNVALLVNARYSKLAPYIDQPNDYKCPVDRFVSAAQRARGMMQRARSYCSNIYVGDGNAEAGPVDPIYRHLRRNSEFLYPGPAETWVFLEEHPDSMNDLAFFSPHATSWIDLPSTLHFDSASFAFADGHSEMHRWQRSLAAGRAAQVLYNATAIGLATALRDPDIHWVAYGTPRVSTNSY